MNFQVDWPSETKNNGARGIFYNDNLTKIGSFQVQGAIEALNKRIEEKISQGSQGHQGEIGPQGIQGSQGHQGEIGPQGIQGSQGHQGEIGPQGIQGSQGHQGEIGPQGIQGSQGHQGEIGPQGIQGSQGHQGEIGPQGIQGSQGHQGEIGPQGIQGSQGHQGEIGPQGIQGDNSKFTILSFSTSFLNPFLYYQTISDLKVNQIHSDKNIFLNKIFDKYTLSSGPNNLHSILTSQPILYSKNVPQIEITQINGFIPNEELLSASSQNDSSLDWIKNSTTFALKVTLQSGHIVDFSTSEVWSGKVFIQSRSPVWKIEECEIDFWHNDDPSLQGAFFFSLYKTIPFDGSIHYWKSENSFHSEVLKWWSSPNSNDSIHQIFANLDFFIFINQPNKNGEIIPSSLNFYTASYSDFEPHVNGLGMNRIY